MKKVMLLLVGATLLASCQNIQKENEQLTFRNDSLISALTQKNAELQSALDAISEIQTGFDEINEAEGRININTDTELSASSKDKMKENMNLIRETMKENKEKIAELESKLKASGNDNASLRKIIKSLNEQMTEKTSQIAKLQAQIAKKDIQIEELGESVKSLTANVDSLQESNQVKEQKLAEQDQQINRAWYVYGTAKELKEQNILKNNKVLEGNDFNMDYFTPIDVRTEKEFPLYAKHAELLSTHPEGSWFMKTDENKEITFIINDPEQFWSVSKYMVIKVK